jgi:RNA polymerase sigma factor (sigma-70 family)
MYICQHRGFTISGKMKSALGFSQFKGTNGVNFATNTNGTVANGRQLTADEYGAAYRTEFKRTVGFLMAHGLSYDSATEIAQAAWAKGWEHRHQLKDRSTVAAWANTIALNLYRRSLRSEPRFHALPDLEGNAYVSSARIDVARLLAQCSRSDRLLLQGRYLDGYCLKELANLHGWTESAVRIRLLRARRRAHRRLRLQK